MLAAWTFGQAAGLLAGGAIAGIAFVVLVLGIVSTLCSQGVEPSCRGSEEATLFTIAGALGLILALFFTVRVLV